MSRAVLILHTDDLRRKAIHWITKAPKFTRVEFKGPKRTLPQNDRMWAMLTDVAQQSTHFGRRYTAEKWKVIFMHELGQEVEFVPSLDGTSFIPIGHQSSDLSVPEMTALIELIFKYGAENGVMFHEREAA
jgi:hypothetical protein